ncbi:hypothetical protein COLO4_08132 [Corchorus olitorius]|uniref:Uncharacterized protein n=1 Tax=Corchorus olitorius TaxID=93759 RepID=A0A1R3KHB3_9ROSI|nr:hypothetical protein COLO4_08132 [Corchorus olitorius]
MWRGGPSKLGPPSPKKISILELKNRERKKKSGSRDPPPILFSNVFVSFTSPSPTSAAVPNFNAWIFQLWIGLKLGRRWVLCLMAAILFIAMPMYRFDPFLLPDSYRMIRTTQA